MKRLLLTAVLAVLMIAEVHAESFTISDIRVNGLQRVSAGSVFGALPLNVGEVADDRRLVESTRALFKTGFFQDIQLGRDGNVLVITVVERPSVSSITIDGSFSPKRSPKMMWDGRYRFLITVVIAAITVVQLALFPSSH